MSRLQRLHNVTIMYILCSTLLTQTVQKASRPCVLGAQRLPLVCICTAQALGLCLAAVQQGTASISALPVLLPVLAVQHRDPARWQTRAAGGVHCESAACMHVLCRGQQARPARLCCPRAPRTPSGGASARAWRQPSARATSSEPAPRACAQHALHPPCAALELLLPEHCCAWHPNIWLGCRAASESSIAMAYRLADTLAAHGPAAPVDIDAAMQAISLTCISQGGPCVMLCLPR